jgi:glycosyltransferase involved in cell wall biosynthesis
MTDGVGVAGERREGEGRSAVPPRRVCFVMVSDTWGGAELHTLALTEVLAARGHHCTIVELEQPVIAARRHLVPRGVEVRSAKEEVPGGGSGWPYRYLRSMQADVGVFAKSFPRVGTTGLDLACRLAFKGRFLTIEHLMPPPRGPRTVGRHFGGLVPGLGISWHLAGLKVYVRSLFPRRIATVSRAVTDDLVQGYGFPARKMVPIPNGIDPERFKPDPEAGLRVRAAWGVPADAVVFGSLGRISIPDKGLDVSIDLFARLCAAHPERTLRYVLVGEGKHEERLRKRADETDVGSRILFTGSTDRAWEAYCGMDVFVMPSRYEGIGFALLEAMACGVCPVAMGVGGVRDVLTDRGVGRLAPAGDREVFYRGMEDLLALGPDGRAEMGRRARAHVERHFRASVQYGKLADVVERM